MAATMEANHGLLQDVLAESRILQALIDANKFNIDAANNILFLPRNFDLADATGTARHAGNHAPVGEAQKALLDAFDKTPTSSGKTYGDLLQADPQTLTAAENTLRTQIMDKAVALANDVQDVTNKAIVSGELPLTKSDPRYASLTTDAAKDAAWRADINKVYGTSADGFSAFETERQGAALATYRAEGTAMSAAGGDLRWRAFDTPEKVNALLATAKQQNIQLFGTISKEADLRSLSSYLESKHITLPVQVRTQVAEELAQAQVSAAKTVGGGLSTGKLIAGGALIEAMIAVPGALGAYANTRKQSQSVGDADISAGKVLAHDVAVGLLIAGATAGLVVAGVPTAGAVAIVAGAGLVGAVADSAYAYAAEPMVRMGNALSGADYQASLGAAKDIMAGIARWEQEVVVPYLKTVSINLTAFAQDPQGYLASLGQSIYGATKQGLSNILANGGQMITENVALVQSAIEQKLTTNIQNEAQALVVGFGVNANDVGNKVNQIVADVSNTLYPTSSIPTNPTTFDLTTDPSGLKPTNPDSLGSSAHGWGNLAGGAGYNAAMASQYVNGSGLAKTVASNLVADATRPGNHSLNDTADVINAIRALNFSRPKLELSAPDTLSPEEEASRISLLMQTTQDADNIAYTDPLSLDVAGDGILMSANPANFDLNADGVSEAVHWSAPTDPLLVLDLNGDGRINNGTELVDLTDSGTPLNLFSLDSLTKGGNGDLKLDALDTAFSQLQLWVDRNQDGYASAEERQGLASLGIQSIDLNPTHLQTSTAANPVAGKIGIKGVVATYADGRHKTLWDVPFDNAGSAPAVTTTAYGSSGTIDKITGSGQVALVAKSGFGVTLDLNNSGADQAIGSFGNDTLIGTAGDDWLTGGAGADRFNAGDGADLLIIDADDQPANIDAGAGIDTILVADDRGVFLNLTKTHSEVVYGGYGDDVFVGGGADNYFIDGAAGDDLLIGGSVDDVLSGGDGADVLEGLAGDDLMRGHRGNDQLLGGDGNDVLDGGLDNDDLQGGNGNDVILASGGTDTVDGGTGTDLIELKGGLEDYSFAKNADGSWTITDRKNSDGKPVLTGQVSDRNGVQQVKNVERFSFMRGQTPTAVDFGMDAPLTVNDRITVGTGSSYSIAASSLLANDIDFQNLAGPKTLSVYWVGDALGGSVALSADGKTITFTPTIGSNVNAIPEFSYKVMDAQGNKAPVVTNSADPTLSGELKGRALLVPANAPDDPEYIKQWYLGAINAQTAWHAGYTGKGVKVLVLEPSGQFAVSRQVADLNHPDLIVSRSASFVDTAVHSTHATAVAGVIGATRNNGIGGVGVAYDAQLNAIGLAPENTLNSYRNDLANLRNFDIVNNSWGHDNPWNSDSAYTNAGLQQRIDREAIEQAATYGRNGLGTVMVFGAGNDRAKGYDAGLSSLTNNGWTINVGAVNRTGDIGGGNGVNKPFSNRGANILVASPGSNIVTSGVQIETANGTVIGSNNQETQGTSFAAPIVSGVAALMLQANPNLSYRDVQTILAFTARKDFGNGTQADTVWHTNHDSEWNGVGMHYSHDFGFGMVDAAAAVRLAESWVSEGNSPRLTGSWQNAEAGPIPDLGKRVLSFNIAETIDVEQVVLKLKLDHPRWSDLVVTLISPTGTRSILLDRPGLQGGVAYLNNPANILTLDQQLMSVHFRGENSAGTWQLEIEDKAAGQQGSGSLQAALEVVGIDPKLLKRYLLTDEYAGGWNIGDIPATPSELNAAAVSGNVNINLASGSSNLAGKPLTLGSGIDRVLGGAGNDTLQGSNSAETIIGGNGNDVIDAGANNDRLEGGRGMDTLKGGSGADYLDGGADNDLLYGGDGNDLLIGGSGNDQLWGDVGADVFLIDGDAGITTTIVQDFNAAAGDVLRIRSKTPPNVVQSVSGGSLTLTFNVAEGSRTVQLVGVNSMLTGQQIGSIGTNEQISVDSKGDYTGRKIIAVSPVASLTEIAPTIVARGSYEQRFAKQGLMNHPSQYIFVDISQRYIKIPPDTGKQIAIAFGNDRYVELPSSTLEAKWSGLKTVGNNVGPALLVETEYSNNGMTKVLVDLAWPRGSDANELLVAGGALGKPDPRISDADWEDALHRLGLRRFNAGGGTDELIGDSSNELFDGGNGDDVINGGGGNDTLTGGEGSDQFKFNAGFGQDSITDPESADWLHFIGISQLTANTIFTSRDASGFTAATVLGTGSDRVSFQSDYDVTQLASSNITLYRTQLGSSAIQSTLLTGTTLSEIGDVIVQEKLGSKIFNTLGGDDIVFALKQYQLDVDAGDGNDTIYALEGQNTIRGGNGDDRIQIIVSTLAGSNDTLIGGAGDDYLTAGGHGALIYGDDTAGTLSGNDTLQGGAGNDIAYGGGANDILRGADGNDSLYGQSGQDVLDGGIGDDTLDGGSENDVLNGGSGNDILVGDEGIDVLSGGTGNDSLEGGFGNDVLLGGDGNDNLTGGAGDDLLETGSGQDIINLDMSSGNDRVSKLTGVDTVIINGISDYKNHGQLKFELLGNGTNVKLSWGLAGAFNNSLVLDTYDIMTKFKVSGSSTSVTLRDIFNSWGYTPDNSFDYLGQYDTQLLGNTGSTGILIGSSNSDQLFGGPLDGSKVEDPTLNGVRNGGDTTLNNAAYWYVAGRDGDDSLAGGLAGAVLDGGTGNDKFRGSNGITLVRDTFHGGKDTLVMPFGVVPESLQFYRIPNPIEVAYNKNSYGGSNDAAYFTREPDSVYASVPLTNAENTMFLNGYLTTDRYQNPPNPGYIGDSVIPQHFDTLRMQSADGKYVVDVVGYFESGGNKNDIANIVFPSVFDAQGNSISYGLDNLAMGNIKGTRYKLQTIKNQNSVSYLGLGGNYYTVPRGDRLYRREMQEFSYEPSIDGSVTVGSESGTHLQGRVKVSLTYHVDRYSGLSHVSHTDSYQGNTTVSVNEYNTYRTSAGKKDSTNSDYRFINGAKLFNYFSYNQPASNSTFTYNYTTTAIALPDVIYGFGGNDTVDGGGAAFVETHYYEPAQEQPYEYLGRYSYFGGFTRDWVSDFFDEVNGGSGDDTYIYRKGYGNLRIVALDEFAAGAEGFDTLDMSDFNRAEVSSVEVIDANIGAFSMKVLDRVGDTNVVGEIVVEAGASGQVQIDQIRFKDGLVDIQTFLNIPVQPVAADSRPFTPTKLAAIQPTDSQLDFDNLTQSFSADSIVSGTPNPDIIRAPNNGLANGYEGQDEYVVDLFSTDFTILVMDKGDSAVFDSFQGSDWIFGSNRYYDALDYSYSLESWSFDTYLGKSYEQWLSMGIKPIFGWNVLASHVVGYGDSSIRFSSDTRFTIELGKFRQAATPNPGKYSLADWQSIDDADITATDALVHWQTANTDGTPKNHFAVLAGAVDSAQIMKQLNGNMATQGDDVISYYGRIGSEPLIPDGREIETFALGGNDTVAGYANDYFDQNRRVYLGFKDVVHGGVGNDLLDGGADTDRLYGGAGNDTLVGGLDDDLLVGGAGADSLIGGTGNDVYIVDASDIVVEDPGNQIAKTPVWNEATSIQIKPSQLPNYSQLIHDFKVPYPYQGNQVVWYTALEVSLGGDRTGDINLWESLGTNRYLTYFKHTANLTFQNNLVLAGGIDEVRGDLDINLDDIQYVNVENATALGITAHRIDGNGGDNILTGNGASTLAGKNGNDTYILIGEGDSVIEAGNAGLDTIKSIADVWQLADNVENLVSAGISLNLFGNALDNHIVGDEGDNRLDGGFGADTLEAGAGNDVYFVDNPLDTIIETTGNGTDTVWVNSSYILNDSGSNDIEIMRTDNRFGVSMTGNKLSNQLIGSTGDDTLNGGEGNDTLIGGAGDDTYIGGTSLGSSLFNPVITEDVIEDFDNTPGNQDVLKLGIHDQPETGSAELNVQRYGDDLVVQYSFYRPYFEHDTAYESVRIKNYFLDNAYHIEKIELPGEVTIVTSELLASGPFTYNGTNNNDVLSATDGVWRMFGLEGNDTYVVDNTNDVISETANAGTDTVQSSVSYSLAANVENLTLTGGAAINGTGNGLSNILTGNGANNVLSGGLGNDTLSGGIGNDTLYGGSVTDTAPATVINQLVINAKANLLNDGVGANMDVYIDGVLKTTFSVTNTASYQNYTVAPGLLGIGAHRIDVAFSNDAYIAGTPIQDRNLYINNIAINGTVVAATADGVYYDSGSGVAAFDGKNLVAGQVTLASNGALRFSLDGNDRLDGGAGTDTMSGGFGNDIYIVGEAGDSVTEAANAGIDLVQSSISYDLNQAANVENLTLTGSATINATGNALDNTLLGNSANNRLDGGLGVDRLIGGLGNDTYVVDNGSDVIGESTNSGTDSVESSVSWTLGAELENLTLTGTTATNGTGNSLNNVLKGNSAVNSLSGAAGNDTLDGGAGADTLTGGTGNDTYVLGRGYAADTVVENDATAGNTDIAQFLSGIAADQLWFQHVGNNLEASIIGTSDKLVLKDWYTGTANHVEQFKTTDGALTLLDSQVENLVSAMAAFAPPAAGQTTLPTNYQTALAPVIAANWH